MLAKEIKYFSDKELKKEVAIDDIFDFGVVPAGEKREFSYYVVNVTENTIFKFMEFKLDHKELKITEAPKELASKEFKPLKLVWAPSITVKEGLKVNISLKAKQWCLPK